MDLQLLALLREWVTRRLKERFPRDDSSGRPGKPQKVLLAVKTDDTIRIRGVVQKIRARTAVVVVPANVVGSPIAIRATNREMLCDYDY
jgi:hypothetical protein